MNDIMVSIRMPQSLLLELKELVKKQHFLDLSEQIRSIVRKKWIQYSQPELYELKKLREEIQEEIKKRSIIKVREEVNKELNKIKDQLKKEGFLK
jgi:Arc/MetJ-type ribon-helix-helix transcriptional regulator